MSDSLNLFARAVCYQGQQGGGALTERFFDWINPAKDQQPEMTADEIKDKFLRDLGGHK